MYYFKFNSTSYYHSPHLRVILGWENNEPILGDSLKNVLGMTEEQAAEAHAEGLLNELRAKRDALLAETDWVAGTDVPQALKDTWMEYRQALRDLTNTYSSLEEAVFPPKPQE